MRSPARQQPRWAAVGSEVLSPVWVTLALLVVVTVQATGSLRRGLGYAAVAILFTVALPYAVVLVRVRRGRVRSGRFIAERAERPLMMLVALASLAVGLVVLAALDAPRELFAVVAAILAGVVVTSLVTLWWKISIHASSTAGTVAVLVLTFGPAGLLALPLLPLVCWARVALGAHTVAQVAAGSVVGAVVTGAVVSALN